MPLGAAGRNQRERRPLPVGFVSRTVRTPAVNAAILISGLPTVAAVKDDNALMFYQDMQGG